MWIDDLPFTIYHFLRMRTAGTKIALCVLIAAALSLPGCGGQNAAPTPTQMMCPDGVTRAEVIQAAGDVLSRMHLPSKLDAEQGLVRTRPLRGAHSSSSGTATMRVYNWKEANLQSVRRSWAAGDGGCDRRPEDRTVAWGPGRTPTAHSLAPARVIGSRPAAEPAAQRGHRHVRGVPHHSASMPTLTD
jgi:hypothetical protein